MVREKSVAVVRKHSEIITMERVEDLEGGVVPRFNQNVMEAHPIFMLKFREQLYAYNIVKC